MKRLMLFFAMSAMLCFGAGWDTALNNRGSISVSYNGARILGLIDLAVYNSNYSKKNFSICGGSFTKDNGVTQLERENEFCQAKVTVTENGDALNIALDAEIAENQYLEFGLYIHPELTKLMEYEDGKIIVTNYGQTKAYAKGENVMADGSGFAIETPLESYEFKNSAKMKFTLQDKRSTMNCFRYIGVGSSVNSGKRLRIQETITLNIRNYAGKELALRKARLANVDNIVTSNIAVSNANFDNGLEEWEHASNATAEFNNAINGMCAKLVVDDPMVDNVYITRLIPCIEGAHYKVSVKIKTENVDMAKGKMSSVGACLIVEWADKNRKWMTSGEYSPSLFGTNDWTNAACNTLRAPMGSGYLSIFLALRGKGTAWFEDFDVTQVQKSAVKVLPEDDSALDTNAPEFRWLPMDGIDTCTLEISQSKDFPAEATHKYDIDVETSYQMRKPLQPGIWYWRVTAPGYLDMRPWKMDVTIPQSRNMLPPLIRAEHGRVLSATEPYSFEVEGEVAVSFADSAESFKIDSNGKKHSAVPNDGWRQGFNSIVIKATGANGASSEKTVWIACAPKPEKVVVIDGEGRYTENGRHIFPLGIYEVAEKYMAEVKESGLEVVHSYRWENSKNDEEAGKYLDECAKNGLRCFMGFDRGHGSGNGIVQSNFEHVAKRVATFAAHPGMFCWYLFDEPEIVRYYVPPKKLTAFADLVRKLDPYHPVVMTTWGKNINDYRRTWDTHWTQSGYSTPDVAVKIYNEQFELLHHDSPITMIIQCYDQEQSKRLKMKKPVDWDKFSPDYAIMRADALVGISKNINGLWWWWYSRDATTTWMTAAQNPKTWNNMKTVLAEVISLRPILNASGEVQMGTVEVGDRKVEWWCKRVQGKDYIIAVNTSEKEVEATVAPKGVKPLSLKLGRYGCYINFGNTPSKD